MESYKLERPTDLGKLVIVGGPGGSGSSTVAKILAKKWGLNRVDAGEIMRNKTEQGETGLGKFLDDRVSKFPAIDQNIDQFLVKMSYYPNMLIEGKAFAARATVMGIPCTLKVWIDASLHKRVMRILERDGILKKNPNITKNDPEYQWTRTGLIRRLDNDIKRWRGIYQIDLEHPERYNDFVIDTTSLDVGRTIHKLFEEIAKNDSLRKHFSPSELKY